MDRERVVTVWRGLDVTVRDLPLAVLVAVAPLVPSLQNQGTQLGDVPHRPADALAVAVVALQSAPLAVRRRWPAVCLALVSLGFAVDQVRGYHSVASIALPVALVSTGAHLDRFRRTAAVLCTAAYLPLTVAIDRSGAQEQTSGYLTFYLLLAAAWCVGAWLRQTRAAEAEHRTHAAESARVAERTRIARELHDVVTHHVTAMVVQAEAARYRTADPDALDETLTAVTDTGRRAITDLRHLLGVLDPGHSTVRATDARTPAVGDLAELVEQTRRAGQPVEYVAEGDPRRSGQRGGRGVPCRPGVAHERAQARPRLPDDRHGPPRRRRDHRRGPHRGLLVATRSPRRERSRARRAPRARGRARRRAARRPGARWWVRRPRPHPRGEPVVTEPVRVLVCDDQALIRTGFATIIGAQPDLEVVGECGDGRAAVDLAGRLQPDVVVMDVRMPVLDGIEATRLLAGAGVARPVKVLVVTTFNLDEYVYEALRAGASGFLLKDAPPAQLLHGIRTVASGAALLAPEVTRRLVGRYAGRIRPPDTPPDTALTPRELEVLRLLADGLSNSEIAATLVISPETVKTYVSRILTKLDLRDRVQAVVYAYRRGLAG